MQIIFQTNRENGMETLTGVAVGGVIQRGERDKQQSDT